MSRDHEVILERCKALLIKSVPQPAPVTKFDNYFDKSNKLNDKQDKTTNEESHK